MKRVIAAIRWLIWFEIGQYRSLFRWIARRPDLRPGAVPFAYFGAVSALIWVFIVGSAIELVALHYFIPWETIRLVVDVLSLWGLIWMIGYMAGLKVHPHAVDEAGIRIRSSISHDFTIPWDAIDAVAIREHSPEKAKTLHLERTEQGTVLSVTVASRTNVTLTLRHPVVLSLSKGAESVTEVRFYADDPRGLAKSVREHRAKQS